MNRKEFMELHDKCVEQIIEEVKRMEGEDLFIRILQEEKSNNFRRTVIQIGREVYEVYNDGDFATHRYRGYIQ